MASGAGLRLIGGSSRSDDGSDSELHASGLLHESSLGSRYWRASSYSSSSRRHSLHGGALHGGGTASPPVQVLQVDSPRVYSAQLAPRNQRNLVLTKESVRMSDGGSSIGSGEPDRVRGSP